MKKIIPLLLSLNLAAAGIALPAAYAQTSLDTEKIAAVKQGKLDTAHASWWGFDAADATDALQNAINSGVPKLIVDNTGSDWIINKPIQLASNQEIVFADGVVVQAKEGCFKGKNDSLFTGTNINNLIFRGEGTAVLRMRKKDYQNPALYEKAEWRMGISLTDCTNVTLRNLTVTQTGGDGLYLGGTRSGYNKNILVEDMNFIDNHRLGMGVISVEDLTIRRSKFNDTKGTGPNAGIDFEPNFAQQRLVNIVVEDSEFNNNSAGAGIHIYAGRFNATTKPISMAFNRCSTTGNKEGAVLVATEKQNEAVRGLVTFNDCSFQQDNIQIHNPVVNGVHYQFNDTVVDCSSADEKKRIPVVLNANIHAENGVVGGIHFKNTTLIPASGARPIASAFQVRIADVREIDGSVLVQQGNQKVSYNLPAFVSGLQDWAKTVNNLRPQALDPASLQIPSQDAARTGNDNFFLQGAFQFLQYARAGQQITVNLRVSKVYERLTEVELQDPQGKTLQTYKLPLDGTVFPITFTATETGFYRVVRKSTFSQKIDVNSSHRGNGIVAQEKVVFLRPQGRIYFQVPAGVKAFTLSVSTDSQAKVALVDGQGKKVQEQDLTNQMELFSATRTDASQSELWALEVADPVWLVTVGIYAPLNPILSTNSKTMLSVP